VKIHVKMGPVILLGTPKPAVNVPLSAGSVLPPGGGWVELAGRFRQFYFWRA
jgi:hypothetical protein